MSNALNKKSASAPAASSAEIFTEILSRFAGIYVLLMAVVFPLFITDMYYNVLKDKYYFFFYSTVILAALCLIILLIGILGGALRKQKNGVRPLKELFHIHITDIFLFAFLLVAAISTIFSEWPYEAFWGNNGRLQGLFFYFTVILSWIMITKFYRFRIWHLYAFLFVGILVCLWGITDYFGLDIFGWRGDANDYEGMVIFTSSFGNINTFTAVVALYMGAFAGLMLRGKINWFFMAGFFITALAIVTGLSDNATLAAGGLLAVLPFFALQDRKKIGRLVLVAALFFAAMAFAGFIAPVWTLAPTAPEAYNGLLLNSAIAVPWLFAVLAVAFAAAGAFLEATAEGDRNYRAKPFLILWGAVCGAVLLLAVIVFIDVNTAAVLPVPEAVRPLFLFDDSWGTQRGYVWRTSMEFFNGFDLFKKLFGSGPETYGIFMQTNHYYEMLELTGTVFDSPHSEPLQYLLTTGILGFLSFYAAVISGIWRGLRRDAVSAALSFGCIAYLFASTVNISTPISTPVLFLMLALAVSAKEHETEI